MSATGVDTLTWSFGLINAAGHYLTIETFGNRINANGTSLKKKQIFTLEQDPSGKVYFRTYVFAIELAVSRLTPLQRQQHLPVDCCRRQVHRRRHEQGSQRGLRDRGSG